MLMQTRVLALAAAASAAGALQGNAPVEGNRFLSVQAPTDLLAVGSAFDGTRLDGISDARQTARRKGS